MDLLQNINKIRGKNMKFEIDTENKTITINDYRNFKELFDMLNHLFPDGSWKEYKPVFTEIKVTELDLKWLEYFQSHKANHPLVGDPLPYEMPLQLSYN